MKEEVKALNYNASKWSRKKATGLVRNPAPSGRRLWHCIKTASVFMTADMEKAKSTSQDKFLVMDFLCRSDKLWYRKILDDLDNYFTKRAGNFPKDVNKA